MAASFDSGGYPNVSDYLIVARKYHGEYHLKDSPGDSDNGHLRQCRLQLRTNDTATVALDITTIDSNGIIQLRPSQVA